MKKISIIFLLLIVSIPFLTNASWWNPLSWNIFSSFFFKGKIFPIASTTPAIGSKSQQTKVKEPIDQDLRNPTETPQDIDQTETYSQKKNSAEKKETTPKVLDQKPMIQTSSVDASNESATNLVIVDTRLSPNQEPTQTFKISPTGNNIILGNFSLRPHQDIMLHTLSFNVENYDPDLFRNFKIEIVDDQPGVSILDTDMISESGRIDFHFKQFYIGFFKDKWVDIALRAEVDAGSKNRTIRATLIGNSITVKDFKLNDLGITGPTDIISKSTKITVFDNGSTPTLSSE